MVFTAENGFSYLNIANQSIVDGLKGNGILDGLAVSERGAGANMSVDIATGRAIADNTRVLKTSITNVVVTASDPTLDRIDIVVLDGGGTLAVTAGTAATVPSPPSNAADEIYLGSIFVGAGVTQIDNANITDLRIEIRNDTVLQDGAVITATSDTEVATTGVLPALASADEYYEVKVVFNFTTGGGNGSATLRLNDGTSDVDLVLRTNTSEGESTYTIMIYQSQYTNTRAILEGIKIRGGGSNDLTELGIAGTLQADWIVNTHTISLRADKTGAGDDFGFSINIRRLRT